MMMTNVGVVAKLVEGNCYEDVQTFRKARSVNNLSDPDEEECIEQHKSGERNSSNRPIMVTQFSPSQPMRTTRLQPRLTGANTSSVGQWTPCAALFLA